LPGTKLEQSRAFRGECAPRGDERRPTARDGAGSRCVPRRGGALGAPARPEGNGGLRPRTARPRTYDPPAVPARRGAGVRRPVHLGGTPAEIVTAERAPREGPHADRPFVLLAQQSLFDDTRAPAGKHTAWAYCHVPHGSTVDMRTAIENQIERFAPGFRDRIL